MRSSVRLIAWTSCLFAAQAAQAQPARLWTRISGLTGPSNMHSQAVRTDAAGNSYHVRTRTSRNADGPFGHAEVVKLSAAGAVLWTRPLLGDGFGSSLVGSVAVDGAGNVIVTMAGSNAFTAPRAYLYKVNGATGAVLWTKSDLPLGALFVPPVGVDASNNLFVGGTPFGAGDGRMQVFKLNGATGAQLWSAVVTRVAAGKTDIMTDLDVDGQNNVAVVGYSTSSDGCQTGAKPMVLSRLRGTDGARLWTTTYIPLANDEATFPMCEADAAGNVYAASSFRRGPTNSVWALTKRNAANGAAAYSRVVTAAAGGALVSLTDLVLDANGVAFSGDAFESFRNAHKVYRYTTAGGAAWNRTIADRSTGGQYYLAGLRGSMRSNATALYLLLYNTMTGGSQLARLNPATGAVTYDRAIPAGGTNNGPVDLGLTSTGDPVAALDTSTGEGLSMIQNARWHRFAAATGLAAATNNGVNSIVPTCDYGTALIVEPAGTCLVLGASGGRIVAQKVSAAGAVLWQRFVESALGYDPSGLEDGCRAIARDAAGNLYGAGQNRDFSVVFQLNGANGATIYQKEDYPYSGKNIALNSANELYLPGSPPNGLRKLAANGNSLWTGTVNGTGANETISYVVLNSAGIPFVVGETSSFRGCGLSGEDKILVARLNPATGATVWSREIAPPVVGEAEPVGIAIDPAGNVVVAGTFASTLGGSDYFAARLNATSGVVLWSRRYDLGSRPQVANAFVLDGSGNIAITGISGESTGPQVWTVKAALSNGVAAWNRLTTSPVGNKRPGTISRDSANNFYVVGVVGNTSTTQQFGLKLNGATGAQTWQVLCPDALEGFDLPTVGAVGGTNLHILGANASTGVGLSQMTLTKFAP